MSLRSGLILESFFCTSPDFAAFPSAADNPFVLQQISSMGFDYRITQPGETTFFLECSSIFIQVDLIGARNTGSRNIPISVLRHILARVHSRPKAKVPIAGRIGRNPD
jgi:hypothetical protein